MDISDPSLGGPTKRMSKLGWTFCPASLWSQGYPTSVGRLIDALPALVPVWNVGVSFVASTLFPISHLSELAVLRWISFLPGGRTFRMFPAHLVTACQLNDSDATSRFTEKRGQLRRACGNLKTAPQRHDRSSPVRFFSLGYGFTVFIVISWISFPPCGLGADSDEEKSPDRGDVRSEACEPVVGAWPGHHRSVFSLFVTGLLFSLSSVGSSSPVTTWGGFRRGEEF